MSNSIVPRANWISDEDLLMIFEVASKIAISRTKIFNSLYDKFKTIGELHDAMEEPCGKLMEDVAREYGGDFIAYEQKLGWKIRNRHRHEDILAEVIFETLSFAIHRRRVIGDCRVETINARVEIDKKSNAVITLGTIDAGARGTYRIGDFYGNGKKLSFFESFFR